MFFVKPLNMEDFHKAVKYKTWSSKATINKKINERYGYSTLMNSSIYLMFSCTGDGRINGLARVSSKVDLNAKFALWSSQADWKGIFEVEWLIVKDMPFKEVKQANFKVGDQELPIYYMRDGDEFDKNQIGQIIEDYAGHSPLSSVVDHFEFYDMREMNYLLFKYETVR